MKQLETKLNILVCQKSKIDDWVQHFKTYYPEYEVHDCTKKAGLMAFLSAANMNGSCKIIGVINYELLFRRAEFARLKDFTLMLDESSMIQNETAKRTKFILKMKPQNVILLSGTPTNGKYENLYSQLKLLGWTISKTLYWDHYIDYDFFEINGFQIKRVLGYKNVDRLKEKLSEFGAIFMKTEEVFDLPPQTNIRITVDTILEYKKFMRNKIIRIGDVELVGDTSLTKRLYMRQLCGQYNKLKLDAFKDLVESTEDRLIIFYNYNAELAAMKRLVSDRPISIINGMVRDLKAYEEQENSITFVQYQAGSKGLNLQKANKIVYFTLTDSCENWQQSKKRIHRIGQEKPCFYYYLFCRDSIELDVLKALETGRDYNDELFRKKYGE